jgi:serine/threonine protein kinase
MLEVTEFLHESGFAHRDIKLENMFLDENLNIKLADFG